MWREPLLIETGRNNESNGVMPDAEIIRQWETASQGELEKEELAKESKESQERQEAGATREPTPADSQAHRGGEAAYPPDELRAIPIEE